MEELFNKKVGVGVGAMILKQGKILFVYSPSAKIIKNYLAGVIYRY